MSRTLVVGDIHGGFRALPQVLERANFKPDQDRLISLGDVADGWPETKECIDFLLTIPNLVYILGNHDFLMLEWMESGFPPYAWDRQGGDATMASYKDGVPDSHIQFLKSARYYLLEDNRLFVHAGIVPGKDLKQNTIQDLLWDRKLFNLAIPHANETNAPQLTSFDEIYIGHSPVHRYNYLNPVKACEVWCMDTGAGWGKPLSVIDVETKEYWQSDPVRNLYPDHPGRTRS